VLRENWLLKTIRLIIRQAEIGRIFPGAMELHLEDKASVVDTIKAADQAIKEKCNEFPVKGFKSLLQMAYHPYEDRFYTQVAVQAYTRSNLFLNVRENPKMSVPHETTIILVPQGGCATDWEEPVK